jgi:solute carrier family 25 protein 39/40
MEQNSTKAYAQHLLAASVGGLVTALVVCPFDVVKTRMQVDSPTSVLLNQQYKGTLDALSKIARTEGILSLWRGVAPALIMAVPNAAIYFNSYEMLKKRFRETQIMRPAVIPLVSGSIARIITVTALSPLELLRTNMQALDVKQLRQSGTTTFGFLGGIIGSTGLKGLWLGLGPTLVRDVPFSAVYWTGYEYLKLHLSSLIPGEHKKHKGFSFLVHFSSGAASGTLAAVLTTPIDVIKTNAQVTQFVATSSPRRRNAWEIIRAIILEEGWRGLTKGIVPRAAKVAPACAIMISSYELIKTVNRDG